MGTRTARLLVVDDDPEVLDVVVDVLRDDGYFVDSAGNGAAAKVALGQQDYDLVVLDVMLADVDGRELLLEIRRSSEIPVILLTGRGNETDRVVGLKMGADDYVVKPFSPPELAARVATVLRRSRPSEDATQQSMDFGDLSINPQSREVRHRGVVIELTAKEFDLLTFLASAPRRVFTREQLLAQVWASRTDWQDPATVTEHIRRVRRKIEDDPDHPRWIVTLRGVGYRFEPSGSTARPES
jgi:DNA-binding response OmpR family regulator